MSQTFDQLWQQDADQVFAEWLAELKGEPALRSALIDMQVAYQKLLSAKTKATWFACDDDTYRRVLAWYRFLANDQLLLEMPDGRPPDRTDG